MGPEGNKKRKYVCNNEDLFWRRTWKEEAKQASEDINKRDNMKDTEDEEEIWVDVDFDSDETEYI